MVGYAAMSRDAMSRHKELHARFCVQKVEQRRSGFVRATDGKCRAVGIDRCTCRLVSLEIRVWGLILRYWGCVLRVEG